MRLTMAYLYLCNQRFLYPKSLAQSEWDNFLLHASKVRKLTFECGTQGSSGSGLGSLSMRRPVPILFPALTTLEWKGGSAKEIRHTKLFISQSLLSVKLEDIQSDAVCTLIKSLATKCSRLRSLHIGPAPQHQKDLVPTTLRTFDSKFPHLRNITSNMPFLFPTLAGLALLPKLTTLSCEILAPIWDTWSHNRATNEPFFPLLRDLSVVVHRPTPAFVKFVDSLANSPIQVFRITFDQSPLPPYLTTLFRSLSKFDAPLHLYISVPIGHRTPDVIYETALIPLSPLRLITLDLSSVPFVLNDESLERIGAAFTDVTCLKLGNLAWPDSAADRSRVTYDGLLNLASFCPRLRFLGLPVDLNRLSRDNLLTPHPRPCVTLERIEVPCEEARDPTTIAAVVSATLPNAQFVPSTITRNNILAEVLESWNEVNRQKDIFFLARQQTWATNG